MCSYTSYILLEILTNLHREMQSQRQAEQLSLLQQMHRLENKRACCARWKGDSLKGMAVDARRRPLHADNTISLSRHARPPIRVYCTPSCGSSFPPPPGPRSLRSLILLLRRPTLPASIATGRIVRIRQDHQAEKEKIPSGTCGVSGMRDKDTPA